MEQHFSFALLGLCLFVLAYMAVALVCCLTTLLENRRKHGARDLWLIGGLLLSLAWPLLFALSIARSAPEGRPRSIPEPGPGQMGVLDAIHGAEGGIEPVAPHRPRRAASRGYARLRSGV